MGTTTTAILLAAALAVGCSRGGPSSEGPDLWSPEGQAAVVRDIQDHAPPRVAEEVLLGCDKWHSIDRPCRDADVRVHALQCWVAEGRAAMEMAYRSDVRQRPRDLKILRAEDACMYQRGWRTSRSAGKAS
jgi:hypothetical protein